MSQIQQAKAIHACPYDEAKEGPLPWRRYDGVETCKWATRGAGPSPHSCEPPRKRAKIADSALDLVGQTPMVRLSRVAAQLGLNCELLGKCEFFNAGGSVKDRIALRMIEDAEKSGRIKPGDTLIEPTSGNTGVGLCLGGTIKGYNVIITLPQKMSGEKVNTMQCLGAQILRTPTEAAWDAPNSHIALALRLQQQLPNAHVLDQYQNPGNPLAHYDGTAEEILDQTDGKIDVMVVTAGTGGTLTGIARKLKEKTPHCQIVGVDPFGSILATPDALNDANPNHPRLKGYEVEGIGYDFIPTVLERGLADAWVKTDDKESFEHARLLIRHEGLLCGGSAGAALAGAVKYIKDQGAALDGKRVVVLFADSSRNYMSKFLDDKWMEERGFEVPK